ncbi:MAG: hypothetical protein WBP58_09125 [Chitinophagaceae bacterium]
MKYIIFFTLVCWSASALAQTSSKNHPEYFQLATGISKHGTGDMNGYAISVDYKRYLRPRTSISIGLTTTIHDGVFQILYTDPNNNPLDGSYRYGTSGIQLNARMGYSMIRAKHHTLDVQLGALLRYQTSSYYDDLTTLYPPATGLPIPVFFQVNRSNQRTVSFGSIGAIQYQYQFVSGDHIGIHGSLQTDTQGDVISMVSLLIGYRLRQEKN